jgi:hypothetical protein
MTWTKYCVKPVLFLAATIVTTGCAGGVSKVVQPGNPAGVSVSVLPATANIRAGDLFTFQADVSGTQNKTVSWFVNGASSGSPAFGTIDANGKYTAPAVLPNPNSLMVKATSAADAAASGSSAVTLMNPTPVLTGINPAAVNIGNFSLTVTGSKFVSGAQVLLNGTVLQTTVNSATQLTAAGNAAAAGTFAISVKNPDPGGTTSQSVDFQVHGSTQTSSCSGMSVGQGASLNGFVPFPSDNPWNKDISAALVDANSAALLSFIGPTIGLHADFGAGQYQGSTLGIPYQIVNGQQLLTNINFTAYGAESDPGPMPIPLNASIEGYPNPGTGDRHVLIIDTANCFLYETDGSYPQASSWNAASAAIWDLQANQQRPYTWTSADAAGLPIFPGLVRYDEVAAGEIKHAIRFTLQHSRAAFTPPASHWAPNSSNANAAPMGMRLRLKASFNTSTFSAANQVILAAMKKYGLILADNGSSMYIRGAPDERWDNNDLHALGSVTAGAFEVVQMNPVYTAANVPSGAAPQISSFNASATSISAGTPVTLSWRVNGASYVIVSPSFGAVRGTSVSVSPSATTTYTLYATNAFGRTTSTVTVTVH